MISHYLAYRYGKRKALKRLERDLRYEDDYYESQPTDNYPEGDGLAAELYWLFTGKNPRD